MVLAGGASCLVSLVLSVLTFSGMQMAKPWLASSQVTTIAGGFMGSILFVFLLTCVGNLEKMMFGQGFQTKWPEAFGCMFLAVFGAATVHRVCATTTILFSAAMLYSMVTISNQVYGDKTGAKAGDATKVDKSKKRR